MNKTILTRDPYDHIDSTEVFLCDVIARRAWGEVEFKEDAAPDDAPKEGEEEDEQQKEAKKYRSAVWTLKSKTLALDCEDPNFMTYRQYLDK